MLVAIGRPVHEHDCDRCIFIGNYALRNPRHEYYGEVWVTTADVYLVCEDSFYKYIVRYGIHGEYATTNDPAHYVKAPLIVGVDPYETRSPWTQSQT